MPEMTPERIAEIRKLCDAATPGPWEHGENPTGGNSNGVVVRPKGEFPHGTWIADCGNFYADNSWPTAHFIAAARTALPEALDEIDRLRKELDAAYKRIEREVIE